MLITLLVNIISLSLSAQNIALRGKVVDEKGEALAGATVKVSGTTTATTTSASGDFTLNVPAGTTKITISFIGYLDYEKVLTKGVKNLGNIALSPDSKNLNEVVVVGYGTLRRQDVTGTVATIDATTLKEIPASNAFDQLKGRVAGLDIVTGTNGPILTLRGNRTISGTQTGADQPLIILDGQPYFNSIENINPNDIKSIDVLKGASATAIYGSRASGGVLLITTNRGRVGLTETSYDTYYGVSRLEGAITLLNGTQFAQLQADALQGAVLQGSGSVNPYALTSTEQQALAAGVSTNYVDMLIKPAYVWDQSLRVSSGTEKTQFTVGAGYRKNTGLEPNNSTDRISLNATLDHKINNVIKFGFSTSTTLRLINAGGGSQFQNAEYFSPLTYPYNPDGSLNLAPQVGQIDAQAANPLLQGLSPNQYYNKTRGFVNNDIIYGELSPVKHLKYRYTANYNFSQSLQDQYNGVDGVTILSLAKTTASTNNNYSYRVTQEHLLTYDNIFAQKHSVNFVAGFTSELSHTQNSGVSAQGIPEDSNLDSNLALAQTITGTSGSWYEQGLVSFFGRVNYAYNSKYDLTATIRNDANSALAVGHQHTTYPSIGLGWVISNESFMKQFGFIDNLKLRGGYGQTSNASGVGPYGTLGGLSTDKYQFGGASTGDSQGVTVTSLVNPTLTWQTTSEYNLAMDFAVLKNRLTGSIEVYKEQTTGIILNNQLPPSSGVTQQQTNLGTSADKGLEITLSSINIQSHNGFTWTTNYNMAFSREKIVALPNGALQNLSLDEFVGQPLSTIYDLRKIGIWQTSEAAQAAVYGEKPGQIKIQDVDGNGKITAADDQFIGNFQPQYTFGMTNRVSYKNFDLSLVIQGRMGFTTIVPYVSSNNSGVQGWQFLNIGRHNQPLLDYWTPTNPTNAFPEPNAQNPGSYFSTLQYYDGSFIRAKSINLGYNVPAKIAQKIGMSSLRLYANVTNPFIIYAPIMHQGFSVPDPESQFNVLPTSTSASGSIGGYDNVNTNTFRGVGINAGEQTRDFIFGINARF